MDFLQHSIEELKHLLQILYVFNLEKTCHYAIQQLISTRQKNFFQKSQQKIIHCLHHQMAFFFQKWQQNTILLRQFALLNKFLQIIKQKKLITAFRQWEKQVRCMIQKQEKKNGFLLKKFIDLSKTNNKKLRYKSLVYQK
jgi:hypothetical protein